MTFRITITSVFFFLLSVVMTGYGQATGPGKKKSARNVADSVLLKTRKEAGNVVRLSRQSLPDSIPSTKRERLKLPDSVGASYENGKLQLPSSPVNKPFGNKTDGFQRPDIKLHDGKVADQLKTPDIKDQLSKEKPALPDIKKNKTSEKVKGRYDSLQQLAREGESLLDEAKNKVPGVDRIYSQQSLKRIYDSLGISKLDSALALASSKREVSKEELLHAINTSFPDSVPSTMKAPSTSDLLRSPEAASIKDGLPSPDLSSMKLPTEDLQELSPASGFQIPSGNLPFVDSLRKLNLKRQRLKLNEEELSENVTGALVEKKPTFWDKAYFEGVLSFFKDKDLSSFQVSPALGYRIKGNLSVGIGPNILVSRNGKSWDVLAGYRSFIKYEVFSQRAYLQGEDSVDPYRATSENIRNTRHSILVGAGYLQPLSNVMALNLCVLYRVNNQDYSGGSASPWVIRLGISSIGSGKKGLK